MGKPCPTLFDPMDYIMPGFPVLHYLPEICTDSHPLSQWCYLAISSSVISFYSCPQYFPASGFFSNESTLCIRWPKYRSFRFSISPSYTYSGLVPLWLTSLTGLQSSCSPRDSQESSPASQLESINSSPLSLLYGPTLTSIHDSLKNKILALTIWTFISKLVSLLFNMLSSFTLVSLSRSKCFLIS